MRLEGKWLADIWQHSTATGNGSTTVYALPSTPAYADSVEVYLNGIRQRKTTDYSVSGSNVTFVTAPAAAENIYFVYVKKDT